MKVKGQAFRSIWFDADRDAVRVIDQRALPHEFRLATLESLDDFVTAIRDMWVRGAPLIGATAAWGLARQMRRDPADAALARASESLAATRPTAVNLAWALAAMTEQLAPLAPVQRAAAAAGAAAAICEADVRINRAIGEHGLALFRQLTAVPGRTASATACPRPLNLLTHCNAGWLATVDWGTATAPIYLAQAAGLPLHVWVDETRPRNQGAALTCWELDGAGVDHTLVVDNAGGHLMQHGQVDLVIVGADRVTANGDVCNKIGTYLKALAARDNGLPFYVAVPTSTIDWSLADGLADIPIEVRHGHEVTTLSGRAASGEITTIALTPPGTAAHNPAFDVTPARLVTGLITEYGVVEASAAGLADLRRRIR